MSCKIYLKDSRVKILLYIERHLRRFVSGSVHASARPDYTQKHSMGFYYMTCLKRTFLCFSKDLHAFGVVNEKLFQVKRKQQ